MCVNPSFGDLKIEKQMINLMSSLNWFFAKCRSLIMSSDAPATNPKIVILLSGKRKSGKDYVANIIQKR